MQKILLNNFQMQWDDIGTNALRSFERVGKSGWYILGEEVRQLEGNLASELGFNFAVACANGLDALEISLRCLGIQPGEKVLTTPLSAFATTLAILRAGGIPFFVDVDCSGLIDLELCATVLKSNPDIKFFVPVHLYGHALNLQRLNELKAQFGLKIVEDCAQAINAKSHGIPVGSVGQMAATSFYPTKNLGCMGDGGAVLTNESPLNITAKKLRDYGQSDKYVHSDEGLNSRLDEVHAAILNDALLPKLAAYTEQRRLIAQRFMREINHPDIIMPPSPEGSESVWHLFPVLIAGNAQAFQAHLQHQGITSGLHYPFIIPEQPALGKFDTQQLTLSHLDNAKRFSQQEVSLPIHPYLTEDEIERIILACNRW